MSTSVCIAATASGMQARYLPIVQQNLISSFDGEFRHYEHDTWQSINVHRLRVEGAGEGGVYG